MSVVGRDDGNLVLAFVRSSRDELGDGCFIDLSFETCLYFLWRTKMEAKYARHGDRNTFGDQGGLVRFVILCFSLVSLYRQSRSRKVSNSGAVAGLGRVGRRLYSCTTQFIRLLTHYKAKHLMNVKN